MQDKIIRKVEHDRWISRDEYLTILRTQSYVELVPLLEVISDRQKSANRQIKLTSTIHLTNLCHVTPKCAYCGFAVGTSPAGYYTGFHKTDDEIKTIARKIEESGIPRVSCSGAHGYQGEQAVTAAKIVKETTSLELLVNVGSDLTASSLKKIAAYGTDTVCCNLETINEPLFNRLKPGEQLQDRISTCKKTEEAGVELSSGLLIGIGESWEDRLDHLKFLKKFKNLGEIPLMGFNPYPGTPMASHPPCSLQEQIKTILVTRIMYPDIRITVPTPTIGPQNIRYSLQAGADNIATVIPENYPADIKGVGSPVYANLTDVLETIASAGLEPQWNPNYPRRTGKTIPGILIK
ncbi:MAG TPA: 5,10-methenyltetrahydromethanopterin hydrogenase cofactor biosynthesis protein HmdB [Methanocorpusculum sp.]|nr:5,10-methenyltetrahydromethanopterin hydrogenase cofactor biosynthesis protein HmdB [Methanocorpusculum sp.]HJK80977.1 5,10-methenyltetrahydromethanopterin hydrogenase cofactor biosynthesis protein HmdB [Methanocorpusculum sp.]